MIRIDSDTHFTPLDAFADLDPKYAEQGPRLVALPTGRYRIDYPARAPFVPEHIKPLRVNGRPKSNFEIEPRLEAMTQDGFDMQVLIPNNAPFYYDVDAVMGANVSRSYNQSIARILKKYPNKFIGIAAVPLQDIKLAIAEAEYAINELGLHSVIMYQNINGKDLDSEFLWPFYEAVEKLAVPLSVHGVDSGPLLGVERFARYNLDVCLGFPFEVFTAISTLIFSGVLDRFPALKFGYFEVGIGWIPWLLDRLEMAYDARSAARARQRWFNTELRKLQHTFSHMRDFA
jgi:aminocarboxymuconate-semialdehyde decarboxylase